MSGYFVNSSSKAASILGTALIVSALSVGNASAQVPADTTRPAPPQVDTTNNLVVVSDTTKEVKHVVKKGDTLWDLAQFYLKDPFRWPEIFRRNTDVVENPHWIYPGEVIRIWGSEVKPEALAHADSAGAVVSHVVTRTVLQPQDQQAVSGGRSDLTVFASPMSRAAAELQRDVIGRSRGGGIRRGEVEAAPYTDRDGGPRGTGRLVASVDRPGIQASIVQSRFQLNDQLYLEPPHGAAPQLGENYMSYILGPNLGEYGQVIIPTGILRVEAVAQGQLPVARIVRQFDPIMLDQRIIPAPDLAIPTGPLAPVAGGTRGKVVYIHDEPVLPSIGHYVIISQNASSGIAIGDEITFIDNSTGREDENPAPPVIAAMAQVVRVTPYAATAIITRQAQPTLRDGMPARVTGKRTSAD